MAPHATVLVVDDDADDRMFIVDALAACGIKPPRVQEVVNGQQALDYAHGRGAYGDREKHPSPCVILLDIKMPVLDGFETLAALRSSEAFDAVAVVMLTGSAQPTDIKRAYKMGANAFLVKPAALAKLTDMMKVFAAFWLQLNVACTADWR